MLFCNHTLSAVFLDINGTTYTLQPQNTVAVPCGENMRVTLHHSYDSRSLSEKEIARDHADDSVVSLLLLSHKPPYFDIVLDCCYAINAPDDTTVHIHRQKIRPIYECSYDRLYLTVDSGNVQELSYTFKEKAAFQNLFFHAANSGNRNILYILLAILGISSIPLIVLCALANSFLGYLYIVLLILVLLLIYWIGNGIAKAICKVQSKFTANHFESHQIYCYFHNMKQNDVVEAE